MRYEHGILPTPIKRYLVKWEGWGRGPAHNVWRSEAELDGAQESSCTTTTTHSTRCPEGDLDPGRHDETTAQEDVSHMGLKLRERIVMD